MREWDSAGFEGIDGMSPDPVDCESEYELPMYIVRRFIFQEFSWGTPFVEQQGNQTDSPDCVHKNLCTSTKRCISSTSHCSFFCCFATVVMCFGSSTTSQIVNCPFERHRWSGAWRKSKKSAVRKYFPFEGSVEGCCQLSDFDLFKSSRFDIARIRSVFVTVFVNRDKDGGCHSPKLGGTQDGLCEVAANLTQALICC